MTVLVNAPTDPAVRVLEPSAAYRRWRVLTTRTEPTHTLPPQRAHVELCGTLVAELGGRRLEGVLPGRKGRMLFTCLVVSRRQPMGRDELIDIVWPHDPPADPDGAFSTLLTRLRTALGRDAVVGRTELLIDLGDDAWVDWEVARGGVAAAEAHLAEGDPAAASEIASTALDIARRPLLPGLSSPWLEDRRRELVESRAALLEVRARAALRLGREQLSVAEASARELIALEPYRESAHALLMETHAARGNVAEALRVFDDLRRLLREELGLAPSRALSALATRLLDDKPQEAAVCAGPPALPPAIAAIADRPLLGRDQVVARLVEEVLRRPQHRCRVLAVTGEPGIGKTRVAAEVAARAHAGGCQVLHGRAARDGVTPYQPFVDGLRRRLSGDDDLARAAAAVHGPELAELARLVPELRAVVEPTADGGGGDPHDRTHRLFGGVAALCEALARRQPLLLVLEDLHWADAPTLRLLRHMVSAVHGAPTTILVTLRDGPQRVELRTLLVDLLHERTLERIVLGALDERDIGALMTAHGGAEPNHAAVRAMHAQTGGNPFFVEELIESGHLALPVNVREAVEVRLEGLPATARSVLRAAAGAGPTFDVVTVARRAEAAPAATRDAMREAVRTGLVVTDGSRADRFAFRHGLVRRALLA